MNLKVRFAVLFTLFVAVILSVSLASIYILYYNYRTEDFFRRVKREGINYYELVLNATTAEKDILRMIDLQSKNVLYDEQIVILDSAKNIKFQNTTNIKFNTNSGFFEKARQLNNEYRFIIDERECIVLYIPESKMYIYSSAYDKYGLGKVKNLRLILLVVLAGGLILTGFISFFYVKQMMKPLSQLALQMQLITDRNLEKRVLVKPNSDEFGLIASSFNDMLDRLEKAFDVQKSFVHHASHELRTPLATMLAQTESALSKEQNAQDYKRILASLKEDQQNLIELTNSLLLLSTYEKAAFETNWPKLRIDELLYDTIETVGFIYPAIAIEFEFVTLPQSEDYLMIPANDALLKSAIRNLVKNACQYTNDTKIKIKLDVTDSDIQLIIENRGTQLSVGETESLFVPFFRGQNANQTKGFGLGLSIVQRIIHLHKGNIVYEAVEADINRFTLTFGRYKK
jgi:signal transduction histidine kinase